MLITSLWIFHQHQAAPAKTPPSSLHHLEAAWLLGHLTLAGLPEDHRRKGALDEVNLHQGRPSMT